MKIPFQWYQNHCLTQKLQAFTSLQSFWFQKKSGKFSDFFKKGCAWERLSKNFEIFLKASKLLKMTENHLWG